MVFFTYNNHDFTRFCCQYQKKYVFLGYRKDHSIGEINMAIYGFIALVAVSLIGWALAECKYKVFTYEKTEEETAVENRLKAQLHTDGYDELSIRDILKDGSYRGFEAI